MKKGLYSQIRDFSIIVSAAMLFSCGDANYVATLYTVPANGRINGRYIVMLDTDVVSFLGTAEVRASVKRTFKKVFSGFSADLSKEQLSQLRKNRQVTGVYEVGTKHLYSVQQNPTWGIDRLDQASSALDKKYNYNATGKGVTAYVVDTGVNAAHTDFGGRAVAAADFTTDKGTNYENKDGVGHGTHVSGTIGSTTYGVAKEVSIVVAKVFTYKGGEASDETVIAGLDFIIDHHTQNPTPAVVNLSLGGEKSIPLDTAMRKVVDSGIIAVVAAGNDNRDSCGDSPAGEPTVITVAAMGKGDRKASYSNWGKCVDVIAPGSSITSTDASGRTSVKDGTSMASPHVAGVVALYLSTNPTATPADVDAFLAKSSQQNIVSGFSNDTPNRLVSTVWNVAAPTPGEPWADKFIGQLLSGQSSQYPSSEGFGAITGNVITATTTPSSVWDGGNVGLYIKRKDAAGNILTVAASEKGGIDETVTFAVSEPGTYLIEVKALTSTKFSLDAGMK